MNYKIFNKTMKTPEKDVSKFNKTMFLKFLN